MSYAMYCLHFPILWLELPFMSNLYIEFFGKLGIITGLSFLAEKFAPLAIRFAENTVQTFSSRSKVTLVRN